MHRFFVEENVADVGLTVTLSREESLHAARVLRLKAGEEVRLLDGDNLSAAKLLEVNEQGVCALITARLPSPEPRVRITLFQGLPKADKLEMIVQKATELGVWEIVPVEMKRSVPKADRPGKQADKRERLQRIALEAAKQSGRAHIPKIYETIGFSEACGSLEKENGEPSYDAVFVAWEEETVLPLSRAVERLTEERASAPERVALVIGPEGGLASEECDWLKARGAVCVTLGKRVLRTETAGLCALSVMWAVLGEM